MEDISLLLSYIETEVEGGKKAFMGGGVVVNGEAILLLVKRIRQQLAAINGQKILAEAEAQAKQILAEAEQRQIGGHGDDDHDGHERHDRARARILRLYGILRHNVFLALQFDDGMTRAARYANPSPSANAW